MSEQLTLIIVLVAVVAIIGIGAAFFLVRGRKAPKGTYTGPRDANDPAPTLTAPETASEAPAATVPSETTEAQVAVVVEEAAETAVVPTEVPEPVQGRLARLRARLAKSNNALGKGLLALLSQDKIDEDVWDEIEETLLLADLGTEPTLELVDALRERVKVEGSRDPQRVHDMLRQELIKLVDPSMDRSFIPVRHADRPNVIMVVGVNGVGKTTTIGKLARVFVAEDKDVLLGAADTFRAAAAEQLATWGDRVGVPTVKSDVDGADPGIRRFRGGFRRHRPGSRHRHDRHRRPPAEQGRADGRAGKIKRVIEKKATVDEVLLVLDATTGQNGLNQARVFSEVVNVTGIVLTKLDGTAKGGIVVAIQRQLGVPVKLVGLGEGPDDLAPFDAEAFVDALLD